MSTYSPRLLVVGSINMDLVLETPRMPKAGESLLGERFSKHPGGKGANQAVAAARAGGRVRFYGKVGMDREAELLVSSLHNEGIETENLERDENVPTGMAVIFLEPDGENRILVYPGANLELSARDVGAALSGKKVDAVLLSFEIPVEVIEGVIAEAKAASLPVYVDAGPARPISRKALKGVTLLSPNETELEALTGRSCTADKEVEEAAGELFRELEPEYLLVKRGGRGALLVTPEGAKQYPAFPVEARDTTAAGDAFTAAAAVRLLSGRPVHEAVRYASAAGALAASRLGAQSSLPTLEEIETFLRGR
jgi:ribokinase